MPVQMFRGDETVYARARHVQNLMAQGWSLVDDEPLVEATPEPEPDPEPDPEPAPDEFHESEPESGLQPAPPGMPKLNASRAKWRDYALSRDVNPEGLNRLQIQQALGIRK